MSRKTLHKLPAAFELFNSHHSSTLLVADAKGDSPRRCESRRVPLCPSLGKLAQQVKVVFQELRPTLFVMLRYELHVQVTANHKNVPKPQQFSSQLSPYFSLKYTGPLQDHLSQGKLCQKRHWKKTRKLSLVTIAENLSFYNQFKTMINGRGQCKCRIFNLNFINNFISGLLKSPHVRQFFNGLLSVRSNSLYSTHCKQN